MRFSHGRYVISAYIPGVDRYVVFLEHLNGFTWETDPRLTLFTLFPGKIPCSIPGTMLFIPRMLENIKFGPLLESSTTRSLRR